MAHLLGFLILGTIKVAAGAAVIWILMQLLVWAAEWRKLPNSWNDAKPLIMVGHGAGTHRARREFTGMDSYHAGLSTRNVNRGLRWITF